MDKKTIWYYWAKALGEKSHSKCDKTSDIVAYIRTAITLQIIITNFFIIFGNIYNFTKPTTEIKCIERTK